MSRSSSGFRQALSFPNFRRFSVARFCATLGWQMMGVAVGWQVYALTHDPLDLGLVGLAQFLPFLLLILPAGHFADRHDRRRICLAAYIVEMTCPAGLLIFTLLGGTAIWPVFVAMALYGAGRAFWMPTGQALLVNLVPEAIFPSAVGFGATLFQVAAIGGPALGGVLLAMGEAATPGRGATVVYASALLLWLIALAALWLVRPVRAVKIHTGASLGDVFGGLRFVLSQKALLGAISLDLFAVLFGGATALLPIFARDILHTDPTGLGLLRAAPGVGAALTAAALAFYPIRRHAGRWMFGGVLAFGVATIVFGLSQSIWLSIVALFVLGAGDMLSVFVRHLLVQLETPDHIRGRVSAVSSMFIGASNELGEFESGVTARWWGPVPAVVVGGAACIVVVFSYLGLFPVLRKLDHLRKRDG